MPADDGAKTPFRWKNCYADVATSRYGDMALSYVRDVIEPALRALDAELAAMHARPDDPVAVFGIGPVEELRRATLLGFCLSVQAMWEKQIRGYLQGCARDLKSDPSLVQSISRATWHDLDSLFCQLRGVPLPAFDEYADLTILQLLGNVCRHGDGPSLERLAAARPDLWPQAESTELESLFEPPGPRAEPIRSADNLQVSIDLLKQLVAAIDSFWRETEYIYNESIDRKHWSLEKSLIEERRKRAGRGRPWDPPAL